MMVWSKSVDLMLSDFFFFASFSVHTKCHEGIVELLVQMQSNIKTETHITLIWFFSVKMKKEGGNRRWRQTKIMQGCGVYLLLRCMLPKSPNKAGVYRYSQLYFFFPFMGGKRRQLTRNTWTFCACSITVAFVGESQCSMKPTHTGKHTVQQYNAAMQLCKQGSIYTCTSDHATQGSRSNLDDLTLQPQYNNNLDQ